MKVLCTPDERFATLPGYPFAPHYHQIAATCACTISMRGGRKRRLPSVYTANPHGPISTAK